MATKSYVTLIHLDGCRLLVHRPGIIVSDDKMHRKGSNYPPINPCRPQFALENDNKY